MDYGKHNNVHRDDSIFAGAIFMSNHATKLECLQRKLFGLPPSKARFLNQVKSGMILFLFEHEERKLYGVFEATSDGAFNIIPDAFRSTGRSYPAQILFKRIWMCRPLTEDEFGSAIKENYYSPNKFHFGLSYNQVIMLIHLFYPRRINIKQYQRSGKHNQIFEKFENSGGTYFMCDSDENDREGNREVGRYSVLPEASMDLPWQHNRYATSLQETATNAGRGSNDVDFCPVKEQLSYTLHSNYETANSQWETSPDFLPRDHIELHRFLVGKEPSTTPVMNCTALPQQSAVSEQLSYYETIDSQWKSGSGCLPHDHIEFHHFPVGKSPSTTPEIDYTLLPQQSACSSTILNNMTVPYLKDLYHQSNTDPLAGHLPCTNYSMRPRMVETQGADALPSLHVLNDASHQTEAMQQMCVSGAQPTQVFGLHDYIPLPEELEQEIVDSEKHICDLGYVPSTALNSCIPSTHNKISDAFSGSDERKHHRIMEADEYHLATLKGRLRLHSDSYMKRASVFSRLSQNQKVCNQNETPVHSTGLSLDQLLNILAEKRDRWGITKVSEQWIEEDCNEQYGCTTATGLFDQSSGHQHKITKLPVRAVERRNNDQYEDIVESTYDGFTAPFDIEQCNEVVAKSSFELPFYNFKRRKLSQNHTQVVSDKYGDICGLERASRKSKRKILRPSLNEEESKYGEAELKLSTPGILDSEVPLLSIVRKFELEGESVEGNHATSLDGTQDFIPIGESVEENHATSLDETQDFIPIG